MKAGTTWLQQQLTSHPKVYFTPEKEIHYFAAPDGESHPMRIEDRVRRFQRVVSNITPENFNPRVKANLIWYTRHYLAMKTSPQWYQRLFAGREPGQWCADFSNLYCLLDAEDWKLIRSVAEEIKVVYTLRHPLKRMWSHAVFHHTFAGSETDLSAWTVEDFERFFVAGRQDVHGDYATNLERLRSVLEPDELMLQFFELVRETPIESLNNVENFLGIEARRYRHERVSKKVNATPPRPMPASFLEYARPLHEDQVRRLQGMGVSVPNSWDSTVADDKS